MFPRTATVGGCTRVPSTWSVKRDDRLVRFEISNVDGTLNARRAQERSSNRGSRDRDAVKARLGRENAK